MQNNASAIGMLEKLVSFIVFSFIAITTERSAGGDGGRPRRVSRARRPQRGWRFWGDGRTGGRVDGRREEGPWGAGRRSPRAAPRGLLSPWGKRQHFLGAEHCEIQKEEISGNKIFLSLFFFFSF